MLHLLLTSRRVCVRTYIRLRCIYNFSGSFYCPRQHFSVTWCSSLVVTYSLSLVLLPSTIVVPPHRPLCETLNQNVVSLTFFDPVRQTPSRCVSFTIPPRFSCGQGGDPGHHVFHTLFFISGELSRHVLRYRSLPSAQKLFGFSSSF